METIKLVCQNCQGTLDVDPNREVISCPYCGEKTLFPESDEVKIAKIENDTSQLSLITRHKNIIVIAIAIVVIILITRGTDSVMWISGVLMMLVIFGGVGWIIKNEEMKTQQNREKRECEMEELKKQDVKLIVSPISYNNVKDSNYKSTIELFKKAGFRNIHTIQKIPDSFDKMSDKDIDNKVKSVSINGDDVFIAGDVFPENATVEILYYSNE